MFALGELTDVMHYRVIYHCTGVCIEIVGHLRGNAATTLGRLGKSTSLRVFWGEQNLSV